MTWKPGDLAEVTWDNATGEQQTRGIRRIETRRGFVVEYREALWFVFDVVARIAVGSHYIVEARRLAVADPAGALPANVITAFKDAWHEADHAGMAGERVTAGLRAALRELAEPKPEEPTGLGAVVEDAEGRLFVRQVDGWWRGDEPCTHNWPAVAAVRVLSPGLVPNA